MATNLNTQGKTDVLNGVKGIYTSVSLFQTIDTSDYTINTPACDSALSISSASWSVTNGVMTNVSDLVFSCTQGDIPYKVVLFSTTTTGGMIIDLTGATGDAFKITTPTGTFTIPAGDLSITVA